MIRACQPGSATAVVGLQWGDEGKGKVVDLLAEHHDAVVRYNGGANAGHSIVVGGQRFALHLVPSGILYPGRSAVIGNGVVVDPEALVGELDGLISAGVDVSGLVVSDRAHVVMPYHKHEDELREQELMRVESASEGTRGGASRVIRSGQIGTTKRGIGPAYADKAQRSSAIRMGDLVRPEVLRGKLELACVFKNALLDGLGGGHPRFDAEQLAAWLAPLGERLAPQITDTVHLLHDLLDRRGRVLFEGGNATLLDVDHGTYPFVTSSSASALGISSGAGVPAQRVERVLGVCKTYTTRVGAGPMPTELHDAVGDRIRERGREYGTTTGRPRRVGWLDLVALRYSAMINGVTGLVLTMLDVLSGLEEIRVCTAYRIGGERAERFVPDGHALEHAVPEYEVLDGFEEDVSGVRCRSALPANAARLIAYIEECVDRPVEVVSVGPERGQTIAE